MVSMEPSMQYPLLGWACLLEMQLRLQQTHPTRFTMSNKNVIEIQTIEYLAMTLI